MKRCGLQTSLPTYISLLRMPLPRFSSDTEVQWTRVAIITLRRMLTRDISVSLKTGTPNNCTQVQALGRFRRYSRSAVLDLHQIEEKKASGSATLFVRTYPAATSWRMPAPLPAAFVTKERGKGVCPFRPLRCRICFRYDGHPERMY
jgi:hypothetical protein